MLTPHLGELPLKGCPSQTPTSVRKSTLNDNQKGNQSLTFHLLLEDRPLPLERTNIPGQGGGQALDSLLRFLLIFESAPSKVEGQAESFKLCGIFPSLGDHSLELVLGLVGVLMGFPFLGLEAHHFLP